MAIDTPGQSGDRDGADTGGSVTVGEYTWAEFAAEHDPEVGDSDPAQLDPDGIEGTLATAGADATALSEVVERRTVDINPTVDEDAFFSTRDGTATLVNRYDLEKAVPREKKDHFVEENRYWVNKPYACVFIFKSTKETSTSTTLSSHTSPTSSGTCRDFSRRNSRRQSNIPTTRSSSRGRRVTVRPLSNVKPSACSTDTTSTTPEESPAAGCSARWQGCWAAEQARTTTG